MPAYAQSDEYYSAVAATLDQAAKLMETGFEYVCQKGKVMLFLKRVEHRALSIKQSRE
jgi:hypothetical protein